MQHDFPERAVAASSTLTVPPVAAASPQPAANPPPRPEPFPWKILGWGLLILLPPALLALGAPLLIVVVLAVLLAFVVTLAFTPRRLALIVLVPLAAFLLAAFPARNSDVWLHLAHGKMLAQGEFPFGTDPFAYPSEGVQWVNHAWLTDLLAYTVYGAANGLVLVLLKAILIGILGWLLLALGWIKASPGIPAVCALLALLALGQGLPLNPIAVSYLFLGLTLWLLERAQRPSLGPAVRPISRYLPVLVLCALWVNLDAWFILGPLTIALFMAGEALQQCLPVSPGNNSTTLAPTNISVPLLAGILAASLAVCLLNPYHIRAFELPPPLSFLPLRLGSDDAGLVRTFSPFSREYFFAAGNIVTKSAYFGLVGLSVISIWLNRRRLSWTWALLWLVFFSLSAFYARLIPFFAIVAGPFVARNLQNWLADRTAGTPAAPVLWERLAVGCGGLLLVLSIPGWLQSPPFEQRGLELASDPALEGAARQILAWRRDGLLSGDQHTFNYNLETAPYLAWLGAKEKAQDREKGFLDFRLQLFPADALLDFSTIRKGLRQTKVPTADDPDWRGLLRKWKINRLILSDGEQVGCSDLLLPLLGGEEWVLLKVEGRTSLLGWRDPNTPVPADKDPWTNLALSEEQRGYHPPSDKWAPLSGPGQFPQPPSASDFLLASRPPGNPGRDEAAFHLDYFLSQKAAYESRKQPILDRCQEGALFLLTAPDGNVLGRTLETASILSPATPGKPDDPPSFRKGGNRVTLGFQLDDGPAGSLFQAIRAARRGIQANPEDAKAWLLLGESYYLLYWHTRERFLAEYDPRLARLRHVQAVTAFRQAVALQPNSVLAHQRLDLLYGSLRWVDLMLKHRKEYLRLSREKGPLPGESAENFEKRLEPQERLLRVNEEEVKKEENKLKESFPNLKVMDRVSAALQIGLGGLAIEVLLASDRAGFGKEGVKMELELLLFAGRAQEVRAWSSPEHIHLIGKNTFYWLQALVDAALGDYQKADTDLLTLFPAERVVERTTTPIPRREMICLSIGKVMLNGLPNQGIPYAQMPREHYLQDIITMLDEVRTEADLDVLRMLLLLENGRTERVEEVLRQSLNLWGSIENGARNGGLDFTTRRVAQHYLQQIEASKKPDHPPVKEAPGSR
jgi:hypothetical protein